MRDLPRIRRPSLWTVLVPVVALVAGLLFATSSRTALGTDLRAGESTQLSQLIQQRQATVVRQQDELAPLQQRVQALTDQAASRNGEVAAAQGEGVREEPSAGLTALTGPGLSVTLDDAPPQSGGALPGDVPPDNLVIHQSDVQGVVNALWAAGADGVAIMGQRLIATSAVICVGNTLLLHGRTYSPPFVVTAVGSSAAMRSSWRPPPTWAAQDRRRPLRAHLPGDRPARGTCPPTTVRWSSSTRSGAAPAERGPGTGDGRCPPVYTCAWPPSTPARARRRQLRQLRLQPGPVPRAAGRAQHRAAQRRRDDRRAGRPRRRRCAALPRPRHAHRRRGHRADGAGRRGRRAAGAGGLPGPPGDRRGLRRGRRPGTRAAARQDQPGGARRCRACSPGCPRPSPPPATTRWRSSPTACPPSWRSPAGRRRAS